MVAVGCGEAELAEGDRLGSDTAALSDWGIRILGPGFGPSLALDENGVPAVSVGQGVNDPYLNRGDVRPVVFRNNGNWRHDAGWYDDALGAVPNHLEGSFSSLAFQGTHPQLLFSSRDKSHKSNPMTLKIATRGTSPGWLIDTFADDGWIRQVEQEVHHGITRVAYPDPIQPDHVRVATSQAGGWSTQSVEVPHALLNSMDFAVADLGKDAPALGIATTTLGGSSGKGGVHFVGSVDGGATWDTWVTIDDVWGMIGPKIAFSGADPMVSYTELDQRHAKFAWSADSGRTWQVEIIDTFDSAPATDIAVDPTTGEAVVAIVARDFAANESRLHLARRDHKGLWDVEIVDAIDLYTGYRIGVDPSIAIADDGTVTVAYEVYNQYEESHIRFAWNDPRPIVITPPGN